MALAPSIGRCGPWLDPSGGVAPGSIHRGVWPRGPIYREVWPLAPSPETRLGAGDAAGPRTRLGAPGETCRTTLSVRPERGKPLRAGEAEAAPDLVLVADGSGVVVADAVLVS